MANRRVKSMGVRLSLLAEIILLTGCANPQPAIEASDLPTEALTSTSAPPRPLRRPSPPRLHSCLPPNQPVMHHRLLHSMHHPSLRGRVQVPSSSMACCQVTITRCPARWLNTRVCTISSIPPSPKTARSPRTSATQPPPIYSRGNQRARSLCSPARISSFAMSVSSPAPAAWWSRKMARGRCISTSGSRLGTGPAPSSARPRQRPAAPGRLARSRSCCPALKASGSSQYLAHS
jgi:hypothetical protein